ncbi:hypothetical protein ACFLZJ_01060 [Nanoarchaeota archaeon]
MKKRGFFESIITLVILSIIIVAVSAFFIFNEPLIGPAFLVLGVLSLGVLKLFKISARSVYPDIVFGAIDNGFLIFVAAIGGVYAGVFGAIIGGAAGNTVTDSLGGLFEGRIAEKLRKKSVNEKRTPMSTMLGKMVGCLFGAGVGLIILWGITSIF